MSNDTTTIDDLIFSLGQDAIDAFSADPIFGGLTSFTASDGVVTVTFTDDREPECGAITFTVTREGVAIYSGRLDPSGDVIFDGF